MDAKEIDTLAHDLVNQLIMSEGQKSPKRRARPIPEDCTCPCCKLGRLQHTSIEGVKRCPECQSYSGDKYSFNFPTWAVGRRQWFRRAFCLMFNIQRKGVA